VLTTVKCAVVRLRVLMARHSVRLFTNSPIECVHKVLINVSQELFCLLFPLKTILFAGENNHLVIDTTGSGKGALSISIKTVGGQEVRHSIRDIGHGRFEVTYYPTLPIPHRGAIHQFLIIILYSDS
jgi:hypothetical protein